MRLILFYFIPFSFTVLFLSLSAVAQDSSASEDKTAMAPSVSSGECIPSCREGYACFTGKCLSLCNPACSDGYQCNAQAECEPDRQEIASPESGTPLYQPDTSTYVDVGHEYDMALQGYRSALNEYRNNHRKLLRFFIAPTFMIGLQPPSESRLGSFSFGGGLGLGAMKHFTRAFGIQSRITVNFFSMTIHYDDYEDDFPKEVGMDLSLDATVILGPFGSFFMEPGIVGSYREYFRGKDLEDEDDEYSWEWIAARPDGLAVGAVLGGGFVIGPKSQFTVGGRMFILPFDTHEIITLLGYFSVAFGSTGEAQPIKP